MTEARTVATRVRVHPGALSGAIRVPGDKSISHRALLIGALTEGGVAVTGVSPGRDVIATARALRKLGAAVDLSTGRTGLDGHVSGPLGEADDVLDMGNSGTGMRLLAGLAARVDGLTVLTGDSSLRRRPMDRIAMPLREMDAKVDGRGARVLPPLVVRGGRLRGITYESPVASAQVKSCVLLAGLGATRTTTVTSPSRSRDHTERLLAHLGIDVDTVTLDDGRERVTVQPGTPGDGELRVPADPSSAAFWLVSAAVAGASVETREVCVNPTRMGLVSALEHMGVAVRTSDAEIWSGEPVASVTVEGGALAGATVEGPDVVDAIDELPVLAVAGAMSREGLRVRDAAELRVKESDRIEATARFLDALGVRVETSHDGFVVAGGQRPTGGCVDAGGDHRIAMSACIAGTVASGPVEIAGFGPVATSYPTFLADFARLGGRVDVLGKRPE